MLCSIAAAKGMVDTAKVLHDGFFQCPVGLMKSAVRSSYRGFYLIQNAIYCHKLREVNEFSAALSAGAAR